MTQFNERTKTYIENDIYKVRLEEAYDDETSVIFVHIEIFDKPSPSIVRELRQKFEVLKQKLRDAGYDAIHSYSANPRFYNMFKGWIDLGPMPDNWQGFRVIKWELN